MTKSHHPQEIPDHHDNHRDARKRWPGVLLALLTVMTLITTAVLGIMVMVGCINTNPAINNLYLVELGVNKTYDIHLRIGYFGGCVTMSTTPTPPPSNTTSSPSTPLTNSPSQTYCITNIRGTPIPDLTQEYWERLNLTDDPKAQLITALNQTLPIATHLQTDVFNWEPPLVSLLLFCISSIMLLTASTASSARKRYKAILLIAAFLAAFAVAAALVTDVGARQAANGVVGGDSMVLEAPVQMAVAGGGDGVYVRRIGLQYVVQDAYAGCIILFYLMMGVIFVRRRPDDGGRKGFDLNNLMIFNTFQGAMSPRSR